MLLFLARRTTRKNDQETHTLISEDPSDEEFSQEMGNASTQKNRRNKSKRRGPTTKQMRMSWKWTNQAFYSCKCIRECTETPIGEENAGVIPFVR